MFESPDKPTKAHRIFGRTTMFGNDNIEPDELALGVWLVELKALLCDLAKRSRQTHEICPFLVTDDADRQKALRMIVELSASAERHVEKMREIEAEATSPLGCSALVAEHCASTPIFLAACVLIGARLCGSFRSEARVVSDIIHLCSTDAVSSLIVRDAFEDDGVLFPWVRLSSMSNIDLSNVDLTDAGFAVARSKVPTARQQALALLDIEDSAPPARRSRK